MTCLPQSREAPDPQNDIFTHAYLQMLRHSSSLRMLRHTYTTILAIHRTYYAWGVKRIRRRWEWVTKFILFNWLLCCSLALHDKACDFCFLPFNACVWCFTWHCWPKWAVSVLEWLSERLLGRMSGTFLNLGTNDLSRACMCYVYNSQGWLFWGRMRPSDPLTLWLIE